MAVFSASTWWLSLGVALKPCKLRCVLLAVALLVPGTTPFLVPALQGPSTLANCVPSTPVNGYSSRSSKLLCLLAAQTTTRAVLEPSIVLRMSGHGVGEVPSQEKEGSIQVDILVEDIELDKEQVSSIHQDALSLVKGALNPDGDIEWGEEIELSVVLSSDAYIRGLNCDWRGKDAATDVLSFPQGDGAGGLLGDLVISIETAERQAAERRHSLQTEMRVLMVHGLLHLLGYDHETGELDSEEMREAEIRVLERLGWGTQGLIAAAENSGS